MPSPHASQFATHGGFCISSIKGRLFHRGQAHTPGSPSAAFFPFHHLPDPLRVVVSGRGVHHHNAFRGKLHRRLPAEPGGHIGIRHDQHIRLQAGNALLPAQGRSTGARGLNNLVEAAIEPVLLRLAEGDLFEEEMVLYAG